MANKKKEESVEETEATAKNAEASEEVSAEEVKPKKATRAKKAKAEETENVEANAEIKEESSILGSVIDTVASAVTTVADAVVGAVDSLTGGSEEEGKKINAGNRAQRVGVVTSDKMTKTVTVRVDRLIKHPRYRRYVRRKKQFMAHDEFGATIGDKVKIIETRPLSARKRWRVVEIIQKAAK